MRPPRYRIIAYTAVGPNAFYKNWYKVERKVWFFGWWSKTIYHYNTPKPSPSFNTYQAALDWVNELLADYYASLPAIKPAIKKVAYDSGYKPSWFRRVRDYLNHSVWDEI